MSERIKTGAKTTDTKKEKPVSRMQNAEVSHSMNSPVEQVLFLQRMIGNQAVQGLIKSGALQAKLKLGKPGDIYEQEADRVAEQVVSSMPQRKCKKTPCLADNDMKKLVQRKTGQTSGTAGASASDNFVQRLGTGQPLDQATRAYFEPRFGHDFSGVRVHTDTKAEEAAREVNAVAFTSGRNVVFAGGRYQPGTDKGNMLLAHELAHVVQQARKSHSMIQRQAKTPKSKGQEPLQVARPPGLPLDGGFRLEPIDSLPSDIVLAIPDGKLVTIEPSALQPSYAGIGGTQGPITPMGVAGAGFTGAGIGLTGTVNSLLRGIGFAAAGENAIGVVGMPSFDPFRLLTKGVGPLIPESASIWGHTAVYVRIGNRIQIVRGFNPASLIDTVINSSGIKAGTAGTAGKITADPWLFTKTSAQSVEFPVSLETANQAMNDLPALGEVEGIMYTARPAKFAAKFGTTCAGTNCVLFAVEQAESKLGGRIAVVTPEGAVPVTSLGGGARTAGQGEFINLLKGVEAGTEKLAPIEGAIGPPVVSGMSKGLQVLKWGGRVFIVIGIAASVAEVATAPEGMKVRTAVGAGAGFLGGLALGATAGLVCGPGAPVCSVVLGVGFGVAGGLAARSAAEEIYDVSVNYGKMTPAQLIETTTQMFGTPEQKKAFYEMREIETGEPDPFSF